MTQEITYTLACRNNQDVVVDFLFVSLSQLM